VRERGNHAQRGAQEQQEEMVSSHTKLISAVLHVTAKGGRAGMH
jgi:hypothetical protein